MTQKDFDTEDTVICLDISRSMARKDFYPSRLEAAKEALITFIRQKNNIDKDDRFALVTFSTNAKILQELTNDPEEIIEALKKVKPQGISSLGEGLAVSLHVVSDQILKQGSNINRVIVISDGKPWLGTVDPLEKAQIMGEIGVIVDTIELSAERASWGQNILESIAILGEYHQVPNNNYLRMTLQALSHKKDVFELKKTMPKLHLIAEYLLNPNELTEEISDAIKHTKKGEEDKCVICRMVECGICGTTECGRLCPYCKTYIHLCCAKKWAEESKMAEASVFRCPHCLFLLRLPEEIMTREPIKPETQPQKVAVKEKKKVSKPLEKVGDFYIEHGQVKLVTKLANQDKTLYLSWENWGSRDFVCNIMSGMNEIICKEFSPKINWVDRTCSGFILRDHTGWFSQPSLEQGIFLLDLIQFENWCKIVLKDIEQIKGILQKRPEITVESDKLIDFEFIVDVNYEEPIDTTDRNKLDQRLLEDAVRYLKILRNRPYSEISSESTLSIPKTPIDTAALLATPSTTEAVEQLPDVIPADQTSIEVDTEQTTEPASISIENPYTGQKVEIPTVGTQEKDIGTARTLSIPKQTKRKVAPRTMPKIEVPTQQSEESKQARVVQTQESPKKVRLRCSSCQKWFEVEKFDQYPCPQCQQPLKLAIQCQQCKNWFSVSKPGRYTCPKCKTTIDATNYS
ncbi:MAG: VWA domain-containing protein [Candidatus Helarchaeota archaeon]